MTQGVHVTLDELMQLRRQAADLGGGERFTARASRSGNYLSVFRGRGMEFDEVRIYQPGDDVRSIDWRVTARTGEPHTKLFREERERPVFLIVDQSAAMCFGTRVAFKSVIAAHVAALFAWNRAATGDRVGALVFNDERHHELRPRPGRRGVLPLLRMLTSFGAGAPASTVGAASSPPAWTLALDRSARLIRPGSSIVVVSDFRRPGLQAEQAVTLLQRHNQVILVFVYDAIERELPPPGLYSISDGRENAVLDTGAAAIRQQSAEQFSRRKDWLRRMAAQHRCRVIELATDENPLLRLRHGLGQGLAPDAGVELRRRVRATLQGAG